MDNKNTPVTEVEIVDMLEENINTVYLPTVFSFLADHMDLTEMIQNLNPEIKQYYLDDWLSEINIDRIPQYIKTQCIVNDSNVVEILKEIAKMAPGKCHTKEDYKRNICEAIDKYFIK